MKEDKAVQKSTCIQKPWLVVAIVHWLISFLTDTQIFTYENMGIYAIWKALFLLLILGFYQLIGYLVAACRTRNQAVIKILQLAGIYFFIMAVFLLLTWPGIWRIDEFSILRTAKELELHYWQGYLTSVYYIICLMLLPFPGSIVLFMCLINGMIVGYLVYKLWIFVEKKPYAYVLYVPFLFFPVIDSNLYPMRMSIYAFLELLLLAKVCFWAYEKRMPKKGELIGTLLLAGIVTSWRSESIYYLLLFPLLLIVFLWKQVSKKQICQTILIYLAFSGILVGIQQFGEKGIGGSDEYEITAIIRPLTPLLVDAAYAEEQDLIDAIDKVINCANIFEGASKGATGIDIFWTWAGNGLIKDDYTREDYGNMKKAYYQLILRHPGTFLRERISAYRESTQILGNITEVEPPSPPLHQELRYYTYAVLELRSFEDFYTRGRASITVYSTFFPSFVLAIGALWLLYKKKWIYVGSVLMVLLKVPLVFLTAPGMLFMYYYSPYLCGWIFLFFVGILLIKRIHKERTR